MQTYFKAEFFKNNRAKLRTVVPGKAPIIVAGNGAMQRGGDEAFKFHQDSSFWYLTGINAADLVLVMGAEETFLIAPTLSFVRTAFDGAHDTTAFQARSGISMIYDEHTGWGKVLQELKQSNTAATLGNLPVHMKRHGLYTLPFRSRLNAKLKRLCPSITLRDIRPELAYLRSLKQPEELAALQKAIDITIQTITDIRKPEFLRTAHHEYQIEAALSYGFRNRGADGHAFDPVVGAGQHATTLHHVDNNGPVLQNDLIVVDVGAAVEHYAADITRTISKAPIAGRKADVVQAVLDVHDYALSLLKPGLLPKDFEKSVETYMGGRLQALKLITQPTPQNIRHYFPHATSHFLGLDAHDAGDYQKPYEPNMVVACEPGIYIPEEGIGVRIEDDVLITLGGNKVMSAACAW